jgi:hypothetical protein
VYDYFFILSINAKRTDNMAFSAKIPRLEGNRRTTAKLGVGDHR